MKIKAEIYIRSLFRSELEFLRDNLNQITIFTREELENELAWRDETLKKRRDTARYPELGNSFH